MPKKNSDFFKEKKTWSEVKDDLLGYYLIPYFTKILCTRKPTIYIDGFAGKGKFDDGKNGSPLTAIECLQSSQSKFQGQYTMPTISMKFIELNHANDLTNNLKSVQYQNYEVISGAFENTIIPLLQSALAKGSDQNVFLYIDPYGVKALNAALFDALPGVFQSAELLINFNSWGLLRMAFALKLTEFRELSGEIFADLEEYDNTIVNSIEEINEIAGGTYWQDIVERYNKKEIDGYQAEKELSEKYKLRLRESYAYVLDMPIRFKIGNHPKYRMVFATNHSDGCLLMADNIAARTDKLVVTIQRGGQMTLFGETAENEMVSDDILINKVKKTLENIRDYTRLNIVLANFFNEHGVLCSISALSSGSNSVLKELERSGYIDVKRTPNTTARGKLTTFWQDGKGKTIEIKRK
ncbi:MAG: three-Cys-motif partner protein TcmP [Firmicutes bacterium]|nr:three-Cys-motif partner protein TcmP [Bacillota bacterium]